MQLVEKQSAFSSCVAKLILELLDRGYLVTLGEAWRSTVTCEIYADKKTGIKHSLHPLRLAIDLELFKDGTFLRLSEDYAEAGAIWKTMSGPEYTCCWGGDFRDEDGLPKPDGNHFSFEHDGVK